MKTSTALLVGSAASVGSFVLLKDKPRWMRYLVGGIAFLFPFAVKALQKPLSSFLFITDTHGAATSNAGLVRSLLHEDDVAAVLHGGDIADSDSLWSAWWDAPFKDVISRWKVIASQGNHDPDNGFSTRFGSVPRVEQFPNVDVIVVPWPVNDTVARQVDQMLTASTARYRILVSHQPLWNGSGWTGAGQALRASLDKVDLILCGHVHVAWDSTRLVGSRMLRQIAEISGPKEYACEAGMTGCRSGSHGYWRIDVYDDGIETTRRTW